MNDITKSEMIGKQLIVVESDNKNLIGIKGTIIDETKNTFIIKTDDEKKTLLKAQIVFETSKNKKTIKINGKNLTKRPEERIKTR